MGQDALELAGRLADVLGVPVDTLLAAPKKTSGKPTLRPCDRRLLALVRELDDALVDDVVRGVKLLMAVGRRW